MIAVGQYTIVDLNDITTSSTAPTNPTSGMLWLNTSTNELKMYNGTSWVNATKYTDDSSLTTFINGEYTDKVAELETEIDTKIITWYYPGVPTLVNEPADNWNTSQDRNKHIGDLYYDQSTGHVYRFQLSGTVYSWQQIIDEDLTSSLALANAAKDTADGKRRVFTAPPIPPYDNGDLWLNEREIYVCQISKPETEVYADGDFIIATKYTDDTLATQVGDELIVVQGTVTTIKTNYDSINATVSRLTETTTSALETINGNISSLTNSVNASITADQVQLQINETMANGVESVTTSTGFTLNDEGLTISKTGSEMSTNIDEDGMSIFRDDVEVLTADNNGVNATNLHATTYLLIGDNSRFEDYEVDGEQRTGCFWIGGN